MIPPTTTSSLSPAQLKALAAQLQGYAQQLRALIPHYAATLQPILSLDDAQTWTGPYATRATTQIQSWQQTLNAGTGDLQSLAKSWDNLAQTILQDAATAAKAAKATSH
jgi:hypothetical protein